MLRCVLLDDELPSLVYLRRLCEQTDGIEVVRAFNDPKKLLSTIPDIDFDVCILDIEMPGINGLEVAKQLQGKAIIFSTAYNAYAADAYDLEAIDYIRKPIKADRLEKAFQKAQAYLDSKKHKSSFLQWNSNKGKVLLYFEDLLGVTIAETDKRDKRAFLKNSQELLLKNISFDQLSKLLPEQHFIRINRQTLLAVRAIDTYTHDLVITHIFNEQDKAMQFPLNEHYRKSFLEKVLGRH